MILDDIEDEGGCFIVNIPITKTDKPRSFAVIGEFYEPVKKYLNLRPKDYTSKNVFLKYTNGKCSRQNIGINTIGSMPKQIATYLQLLNPKEYTGHLFRRSSSTVFVNSGADITALKRHGGWKSDSVAEGYI